MHDNIKETLSALNNIGIETNQWNPLLLCILTKKLDRQNHVLYEQSIQNTKQTQSISEFLVFMEQRVVRSLTSSNALPLLQNSRIWQYMLHVVAFHGVYSECSPVHNSGDRFPMICWINLGLALVHLTQFCTIFRATVFPLMAQYLCRITAKRA